jgi:EAL domain-containing protein (putative c-di-GMP-specific phosphodiesterase class I)
MSTLSEIPWSCIKIDRSLVPVGDGTPEDEKRKILIRSIVSMAGALGINCITEGVETLSQSVFLKSIDCYLAQGFFFDRPMPKEQFEGRLAG